MSAVEAHSISQTCITVFNKIRTDLCFDQFWAFVEIAQKSLDVSEPTLPRQWKRPRCYKDGNAEAYHPAEPKVHYRQIYYHYASNRFSYFNTSIRQIMACMQNLNRFYFWLQQITTILVS